MNFLTLDFETYYKSRAPHKYTIKSMTRLEYVTDPQFKVHMVGVKLNDGDIVVLRPEEIHEYLKTVPRPVTLIGQNLLFDAFILAHHYNWTPDYHLDLKYLSTYVWNSGNNTLENIAKRLWPNDPSMHKGKELEQSDGIRDLPPALFGTIAEYCKQDVRITYEAVRKMLDDYNIPKFELDVMNAMIVSGCQPLARLDKPLLKRYLEHIRSRKEALIAASGVPKTVLSSNKQFAAWLSAQGIKPPKKISPRTGEPTFALAKNDLAFVELQNSRPDLKHVWTARKAASSNIEETRTQRFIDMAQRLNGRCVFPLVYGAAHTLRAGGTDKLNMQNLPRNADSSHPDGDLRPGVHRRAICAQPEYKIVVGDSSNIEARIAAALADHKPLLEIFKNGGDPYAYQASLVYKKPIDKKTHPKERQVGKALQLGLGYGMGKDKFVLFMHTGPLGMPPITLPINELHRIHSEYRRNNPQVVMLWKRADMWLAHIAQRGNVPSLHYMGIEIGKDNISPFIRLPLGTTLRYYNLTQTRGGFMYTHRGNTAYIYGAKVIENVVQGMAGELIRWQMALLERRITEQRLDARYLLQVHDELVYHVLSKIAEEFAQQMKEALTTLPLSYPEIPLAAEVDFADNYIK